MKKILHEFRRRYIINQVKRADIPPFGPDEMIRCHALFSGKVQKLGFRLEVQLLAERLKLTGWVKNLEEGRVEVEIQGAKNKIDFLLLFMNSLQRIRIDHMEITTTELSPHEKGFEIIKTDPT